MPHNIEHEQTGAYVFKTPAMGGTIKLKDTGEIISAYGGIKGSHLDALYGKGNWEVASGGADIFNPTSPLNMAPTVPVQPGITPGISGFSAPITGNALTPISSPAYKDPETPVITTPDPKDLTPVAPTPQEQGISDLIGTITKEQTTLPGEKAAFSAEEQKRLGLETLQQEETDLFSQLKIQQAEFENLQVEDTRIKERLQQESIGRGRTTGGLAPLEAAELRKNFLIKSEKAAQVNVTAAILAGTQNKLLTAQTLIDRAVANKYGARDANLKAKIDNLELLLKDPTLTVAQANRAQKQLEIQNKKKESETKKKADAKTILEWAVEARKNGATALEAQQIANIGLSETPDMAKAFEIYSKFQKPEVSTQVIGSAETGYLQFNPKTGRYDISVSAPGGAPSTGKIEIDAYAEDYNSGAISAGNIPQKIRGQVLTRAKELAVEPYLADIPNFSSLEEALEDYKINRNKYVSAIGIDGYNKLIQAAKDYFAGKPLPKPRTAEEVGKATGEVVGSLPEKIGQGIITGASAVGSFFKGLFGF